MRRRKLLHVWSFKVKRPGWKFFRDFVINGTDM